MKSKHLNTKLRKISEIEVLDWQWSVEEYGYVNTSGMIKNLTSKSLPYVKAIVTFYTKGGTYIVHDSSIVEYTPLMPGQKIPI